MRADNHQSFFQTFQFFLTVRDFSGRSDNIKVLTGTKNGVNAYNVEPEYLDGQTYDALIKEVDFNPLAGRVEKKWKD